MKAFKIQDNSGKRKVFHAKSLSEAKEQARKEFRSNLVYECF